MPTIRDLIAAIRQRDHVDAALLLGRDGLLIDGGGDGLDVEQASAHVPSLLHAAEELGAATGQGALTTAVLEHANGVAVVSALSSDVLLLVLVRQGGDLAGLLRELRRNRANLASLL